ncbi:transporter substrate-binding domain-containing protein [Antarcticibacterium arcticum]|uniref:Transporter substrate-binding domain-containing protein n=1 Tax=Antarcticibacterium arcticum TaxID=2585771 RepID=A0A5B8YFD3_9FLAO|nr:transporter substrate-binding domain-containing protein [Antarcticibacterium arcticum]QED36640.1 transporter substrate-binding domain-containing protein [Antarcticibacterium arcticum]
MKNILFILLLVSAACDFPKDAEGSWVDAQNNYLKVGVSINPPFTISERDSLKGMEIDLLKKFAGKENLKIRFFEGSESELIKKLENYELHVIAGGFDKKTLWKQKAGTTSPYDKEHVFLIAKGENQLLKKLETHIFQNSNK